MYLSDDSMDVEIVSSKSSEMNVMIPKGNGDYVSIFTIVVQIRFNIVSNVSIIMYLTE